MISIKVQRIIQIISLGLLAAVSWNYFKTKNMIREQGPKMIESTAFDQALSCKCDQAFVETPEMLVVRLLPDDTEDTPHQKWIIQSPSGHTLLFTSNLKLCERLELKKGDRVFLGGEFKCTDKGGLIHWTHQDPMKIRRDGYVRMNGKTLCQSPP